MDGPWIPLVCVTAIGVWLTGRCALAIVWAASEWSRPGLGARPREQAVQAASGQRAIEAADAAPSGADAPAAPLEPRPRAAEVLPAGPPPGVDTELCLSPVALSALARDAARGEHVDGALRKLDVALQALEVDGCVVLYETRLDDLVVRRAVIAETGVFVVTAKPPLWAADDGDQLHIQAARLAARLGIRHEDVTVVLAIEGRDEPARAWACAPRFLPMWVLGRAELRVWILSQPRRIDRAVLERLRDRIETARSTAAAPTRAVARTRG